MSYAFNAFAAPLQDSATLIAFAGGSNVPAGTQVHIIGSDLIYDNTTGVMTGTITSIALFDPVSMTAMQTITIAEADQLTLADSITAFLGQALGSIADTYTAWGLIAGGFHHPGTAVFTGTSLTVEFEDATNATVGFLKFEGTNLTDATLEATGTITRIIHLDANGVPVPTEEVD